MKKILLTLLFTITTISLQSQMPNPNRGSKSFLTYYETAGFQQSSPGSFKFGLYGYLNPAMTSYVNAPSDILFGYNRTDGTNEDERWGLFTGGQNSGFGLLQSNYGDASVYDYRYSLSFGSKKFSLGMGYGFVGGDKSITGRSNTFHWGTLIRPIPQLSIGLSQTYALHDVDQETVAEIAIRPFKKYPLAFFVDAQTFEIDNFDDMMWSTGVSWEIVDGVRVNARYFDNERINVGVNLSLGNSGLAYQNTSSSDNDDMGHTVFFRTGAKDRTIIDDFNVMNFYVKMNLSGAIKYQRYALFDNSRTLLSVLEKLDRVIDDKNIKGIVINTVGMSTSPAISWEIRSKLKEVKAAGKKVIMYIERAGYMQYHFASVADKIIMDEMGSISLPGFNMGKSYYRNMLEKLNIGFEELRLFKYKSAVETFAREGFSEGDKEQLERLIESWYETTRAEIAEERPDIDENAFDDLVNGQMSYRSKEAKEKGLIDETGRWHDVDELIEELNGDLTLGISDNMLIDQFEPVDDYWGDNENRIAVIYVLGVCDMESGIAARTLVKSVKSAVDNKNIKAIVLRVDSPGGDALASEYIAKVVRDNKDKKPIIVSQGMVAASGGYWLSMDGDKIFASPLTITGSIGVISAWAYDKGIANDIGITTDNVKVGKYADYGFSFREPILGLGLPVRNLTDDERKQQEESMLSLYGDFVKMVADGRGMDSLDVHEVAQGRVWTGADGKENGLVDEIGGLANAIDLARSEAGIEEDEDLVLIEYPKMKLFDFGSLLSGAVGVKIDDSAKRINAMKYRLENTGIPMTLLPSDYWDIEQIDFE